MINIVDTLVSTGLLTQDQLDEAKSLSLSGQFGGRVDRALVNLGHIEEEQLLKLAGEQLAIPLVDLSEVDVDPETIAAMPPRFAHLKLLMP